MQGTTEDEQAQLPQVVYTSGSAVWNWSVSPTYGAAALQANPGGLKVWAATNATGPTVITYSFPTGQARFDGGTNYGTGEVKAGWTPLSATQQAAVRAALDQWSHVANISFVEVADGNDVGDLRFGFSSKISGTTAGQAFYPDGTAAGGDVWLNASKASAYWGPDRTSDPSKGEYFAILLHEIGHALGLSHPFLKAGETRATAALPATEDNTGKTVMSYTSSLSPYFDRDYPTTPMLYDVMAIQQMYGGNDSYNTGSNTYTFDTAKAYLQTLWDSGGTDTIKAVHASAGPANLGGLPAMAKPVLIDLREGAGSKIGLPSDYIDVYIPGVELWALPQANMLQVMPFNVYIGWGTVIENATGAEGDDQLIGNSASNRLEGGAGNDSLDGGAGTDTAVFSLARSSYTVTKSGTSITVKANSGTDGTDTLVNMERLQFSDQAVAYDSDGNGGKAYRLYQAAFNRKPDGGGLGFQMKTLDNGATLSQVASNFIASPEFNATYGSLNDEKFVTQLYQNVLHRAADSGGLSYHTGNLGRGQARADVLVGFSESPENQAALIGTLSAGVAYIA